MMEYPRPRSPSKQELRPGLRTRIRNDTRMDIRRCQIGAALGHRGYAQLFLLCLLVQIDTHVLDLAIFHIEEGTFTNDE